MLTIKNKVTAVDVEALVGAIILWYGLAVDVPENWEVYAPAKNAFIMGAADGELNTTPAGANTHNHERASANTDSASNHQHAISISTTASATQAEVKIGSDASMAGTNHTHNGTSGNSSAAGAHTHTVSDTEDESHLPPYHRLYWIRKVS